MSGLRPGHRLRLALDLRRVYVTPFPERAGCHSGKLVSERRLGSAPGLPSTGAWLPESSE